MYVCMYVSCMLMKPSGWQRNQTPPHGLGVTCRSKLCTWGGVDMTYYCGTAAMYVELALDRHWREEQWSRTPTANTLQLESATC